MPGVSMCQSTSSPDMSALSSNWPLSLRSQRQRLIEKLPSGSLEADPSRWTVTGAIELAGVAVARAIGELTYFTRTTWPPSWFT